MRDEDMHERSRVARERASSFEESLVADVRRQPEFGTNFRMLASDRTRRPREIDDSSESL
jgi:hypothetical protein